MAGPGDEPCLLSQSLQERSPGPARKASWAHLGQSRRIALPHGPDANGGFEIAAIDLSAHLGELQERL